MSVPKVGDKYTIRGKTTVYKVKEVDWTIDYIFYEDANGNTYNWPASSWDQSFERHIDLPHGDQPLFGYFKCECGVDTLGAGLHSTYCPKYEVAK